jgi:hypothetical protein
MRKHRRGSRRGRKPSPHDASDASYRVGYGRPPKQSQFKPGQSGNPRGKPKGRKNYETILDQILHRKLPIRDRGSVRQVPLIEAMLLKFAEEALRGNPKAAAFLLNRYAPSEPEDTSTQDLSHEDQEILDAFAKRIRTTPKKGGPL